MIISPPQGYSDLIVRELIISVKQFGAVGDGETDDTSAIQSAINFASANGRWVYFPPALLFYKTIATINLPDHVYIKFSPGAIIRNTTTNNAIFTHTGTGDIVVEGGQFYGNESGTTQFGINIIATTVATWNCQIQFSA